MRHPRFPSQANQNFRPNPKSLLGQIPFCSPLLRGPSTIPGPRLPPFGSYGPIQQWPTFHNNVRFASTMRPDLQPPIPTQPRPRLRRRSKPVIFPSSLCGANPNKNKAKMPLISDVESPCGDFQRKVTDLLGEKVESSREGKVVAHVDNLTMNSSIQSSCSSNLIGSEVQSKVTEDHGHSSKPNVLEKTSSGAEHSDASQLGTNAKKSQPTSCQSQQQRSRKVIKLKRNSDHSGKSKSRCKIRDHRPIPLIIGSQIKKEPGEDSEVQEISPSDCNTHALVKIKQEFPLLEESLCAKKVNTIKSSNKRKIELIRPSFSGLKIKKEKSDTSLKDESFDISSNLFNDSACTSGTSSNLDSTCKFSSNVSVETTILPSFTLTTSYSNSENTNTSNSTSIDTNATLSFSMQIFSPNVHSLESTILPQSEGSQPVDSSESFCSYSSTQLMCAEETSQGLEENLLLTQSDSYLDMIYSDLSQCVELRLGNFFPLLSSAQIIKVFGFCGKVLNWEDYDVAEKSNANESLVCLRGSFAAGLAVELLNGASLEGTKLSVMPHTEVARSALQALPPEVVQSDVSVQCLHSIQTFLVSEGLSHFLPPPAYSHLHPGGTEQPSRPAEALQPAWPAGAQTSKHVASAAQTAHLEDSLTVAPATVEPASKVEKIARPNSEKIGAINSTLSANSGGSDRTAPDISGGCTNVSSEPNITANESLTTDDTAATSSVATSAVASTISVVPTRNGTLDVAVTNASDQRDPALCDGYTVEESPCLTKAVSGVTPVSKKRKNTKLAVRHLKRSKRSSDAGSNPFGTPTAINRSEAKIARKARSKAKGKSQQCENIASQSIDTLPQGLEKNCKNQVLVPSIAQRDISSVVEPVECDLPTDDAAQPELDAVAAPHEDKNANVSSENQTMCSIENCEIESHVGNTTLLPSTSQLAGVSTSVNEDIACVKHVPMNDLQANPIQNTKEAFPECESNQAIALNVPTLGCELAIDNAFPDGQGKSIETETSNCRSTEVNVPVSIKQERDEPSTDTQALSLETSNTVVSKSMGKRSESLGQENREKTSLKTTNKLKKKRKTTLAKRKPHEAIDVKPDVGQLARNLQCSLVENNSQTKQKVAHKEKVPQPGTTLDPGCVRIKSEPVDACEEESCLPGFDFSSTFGEDRKPLMSSESTADDAAQLVDSFRDQISALLPSPIKSVDTVSVKAEHESESRIPEPNVGLNVSHNDSFQEDDYTFDEGLVTSLPVSRATDSNTASLSLSVFACPSSADKTVPGDAVRTADEERTPEVAADANSCVASTSVSGGSGGSSGPAVTTSALASPRRSTSPALLAQPSVGGSEDCTPPSVDVQINLLKFKKVPCRVSRCRQQSCPRFHDDSDYIRDYRKYKGVKCNKVFAHFQHRWRDPRFCNRGPHCAFAHNQLEYLFHPSNYKRFACSSLGLPSGSCLFKENCAFRHTHKEISREEVNKQQELWVQREKEEQTRATTVEARQSAPSSSPDARARCEGQPSDTRLERSVHLSEAGLRATDNQLTKQDPNGHKSRAGLRISHEVSNVTAILPEQSWEAGQGRVADSSPSTSVSHTIPPLKIGPRLSVKSSLFSQEDSVSVVSSLKDNFKDQVSVGKDYHTQSSVLEITPNNLFTSPEASGSNPTVNEHACTINSQLSSSGQRPMNLFHDDKAQSGACPRPKSGSDLRLSIERRGNSTNDQKKSFEGQGLSRYSHTISVPRQSNDDPSQSAPVMEHVPDDRTSPSQVQRNSSKDQAHSADSSSCSWPSADDISSPNILGNIPFGSSVKIERLSPEKEIRPMKEEVQKDYETYKKNLVTSDECKEITPLERQIQASYPTIPSLESALVGLKVVENLKMLSDSHIHFGLVGSVLPIIHRKASELLRSGGSPLSVFNDSDNITLLSLLLQKMPKLETLFGNFVPFAKLKRALLEIVAEVDNSPDVQRDDHLGLDVNALARSTVGFNAQQIKTFIEHVLVCDGQPLPSVQQTQIVGMAVAAKHFKMSQGSSDREFSECPRNISVPHIRPKIQPLLDAKPNQREFSSLPVRAMDAPLLGDKPTADDRFPVMRDKSIGLLPSPPTKPACRLGLPPLAAKPFDRLHDQRKVASVTPSVVLHAPPQPPSLLGDPPSREALLSRFGWASLQRLPLSTTAAGSSRSTSFDSVQGESYESRRVSSSGQTNNFIEVSNESNSVDSVSTNLVDQKNNSSSNNTAEYLGRRRISPGPDPGSNCIPNAKYSNECTDRPIDKTCDSLRLSKNICAVNAKRDIDLRFAADSVDAFNIRIPDAFGPGSPSNEDISPAIDQDTDQDMRKPHNLRTPYSDNPRRNMLNPDADLQPQNRDWGSHVERHSHVNSDFRKSCGSAQNQNKKQVFVWSSASYLENRSQDDLCEELEDEYKPFSAADIAFQAGKYEAESKAKVGTLPLRCQSPSPDFTQGIKIKCSDIPLKPVPARKSGIEYLSWDQGALQNKALQVGASPNMTEDKSPPVPACKLKELGPPPVIPVAPHRLSNDPTLLVSRSVTQRSAPAEFNFGKDIPSGTLTPFQSNSSTNEILFSSATRKENSSPAAPPCASFLLKPPNQPSEIANVSSTLTPCSRPTLRPFLPPNLSMFSTQYDRSSFSPTLQPVKTEKTDEGSCRTPSTRKSPLKETWRISSASISPWPSVNSEKNDSDGKDFYSDKACPSSSNSSLKVITNAKNASLSRGVMHDYQDSQNSRGEGLVSEIQAPFPVHSNQLAEETNASFEKIEIYKVPPPFVALPKSRQASFSIEKLKPIFHIDNAGCSGAGVSGLATPSDSNDHRNSSPEVTEGDLQYPVKGTRCNPEYPKAATSAPVEHPSSPLETEQLVKAAAAANAHGNLIKTSTSDSQSRWFVSSHVLPGKILGEKRPYSASSLTASQELSFFNSPKNDSLVCATPDAHHTNSNVTSVTPSVMACSPNASPTKSDRNDLFIVPGAPSKPLPPEKPSPLKIFNTPDMAKLQHSVPRKEWKPPERKVTPPPSPWQSLSVRCDSLSMPSPVASSSGYQSKGQTHIYQFLQKQASLIRPNNDPPVTKEPISREAPILPKVSCSSSRMPPSILKQSLRISETPVSTPKPLFSKSEAPPAIEKNTKVESISGDESLLSSAGVENFEFSINFPGLNPSNMFPDAPKFTITKKPASHSSDQHSSSDVDVVGIQTPTKTTVSDSLVSAEASKLEFSNTARGAEISDEDVPYSPASKYSESDDDRLEVVADDAAHDSTAEDEMTQETQNSPLNTKDDEVALEFEDMVELLRNFTSLDVEEQIAFSKYLRSLKIRDPGTIERLYSRAKMND